MEMSLPVQAKHLIEEARILLLIKHAFQQIEQRVHSNTAPK
jgi:hypothetical protein